MSVAGNSYLCAGCKQSGPLGYYDWPGGRGPAHLCSFCVSGLCEWCGLEPVALSVGAAPDNWRVCVSCQESVPRLRRKRRVRALSRRAAP